MVIPIEIPLPDAVWRVDRYEKNKSNQRTYSPSSPVFERFIPFYGSRKNLATSCRGLSGTCIDANLRVPKKAPAVLSGEIRRRVPDWMSLRFEKRTFGVARQAKAWQ